jgi:hypothetical protein
MSKPLRMIDRARALNGMNRGNGQQQAAVQAQSEYDLPPEAAALQRMVDSFPVGVRAELGEDEPVEAVEVFHEHPQFEVQVRLPTELRPVPKQLTPLEQARKHREESLQLARDLRSYRAVVEQRIRDAEQELKDIAKALQSLPVEVDGE